ncbi:MAG: zf-HC2 domain-containing protein [Chloroflexi bacterium]|nr:zf-HC2 domain-containing protein [Chloroflexota bacterium]
MTHDAFTEKITLWLDNELSDSEVAELQTHLADCLTCQHTYQAMQRVDTLLRGGSSVIIAPAPGFTARFETHLGRHPARNHGHLWLGFGVLLLGTLFLFVVSGIVVSTFVSAGTSLIDVATLYHWLADLIESTNTLGVWFNLVGLFVKVSLITMSQPLFWGYALVALGLTWMWLRLLKFVNRQAPTTVELLI